MEKRPLITIVIIILIIGLGIFFFYKKTCKTEECFNNALAKCKPATYYGYRNNNLYYYKISRSFRDCNLDVRIDRMAIGTEHNLIRLLEDTDMSCRIPKAVRINLDNMENLLNFCHGDLKEGLLQVMVERLYSLIVRDISGIVKKAEEALRV